MTGVKKNNDGSPGSAVVDPKAGPYVEFQFPDPAAQVLRLPEETASDSRQTGVKDLLDVPVQRIKPILERTPAGARLVTGGGYEIVDQVFHSR